jgi:predicted HTH domain antitoxin
MEVTISLPGNQFLALSPERAAEKIKLYAAMGLYQVGELSIGAASELAGLDRYAFLELCKREGITLRTQSPDELEADFNKLISNN